MTKRELEQRALELLLREDEVSDEVRYGDVERDLVQNEIATVVKEYKAIKDRQEKIDFVLLCVNECNHDTDNFYVNLMNLIDEMAKEIGYDIRSKTYGEVKHEEET